MYQPVFPGYICVPWVRFYNSRTIKYKDFLFYKAEELRGGGIKCFIMKIQLSHKFEDIISIDNLLEAWKEFLRGKRNKKDVQEFSLRLMDNILSLHDDLRNLTLFASRTRATNAGHANYFTYQHGGYQAFNISDPKPRNIHKASVRDRLLHHAIYRKLYPFFDKTFISDSYSCRLNKGTHKAINRFKEFGYKVSKNNTQTCWILKCDIRKFFASINHKILKNILSEYIGDKKVLWLLSQVINSFNANGKTGIGLPLGNLTSQLFVNIYMNRLDQFVKHRLKTKYYIRYADDFVLISENKNWLLDQIEPIRKFLRDNLELELHPNKISIKTIVSGVDYLGWVNFTDHRVLRRTTKKRMLKRIRVNPNPETLNSYLGLLSHGNANKLKEEISK